MAMSKKDLSRQVHNIKTRIAQLEPKVKADPLHRHPDIHEEMAKLKKALEESH